MNRLLALPLLALAACLPPSPADLLGLNGDFFEDYDTRESNARGSIRGELPVVGAFDDDDADVAIVDTDDDHTYLELHTTNDAGWGMVALNLNEDELVDGVPTEVDAYDAVGCSGPATHYAEYDEAPEEVVVTRDTIEIDGTQEVVYTIRAVFENGDVVEGEVSPVPDDRG